MENSEFRSKLKKYIKEILPKENNCKNNFSKPSLYYVYIIAQQQNSPKFILHFLTQVLRSSKTKLIKLCHKMANDGFIDQGPFTREVAETIAANVRKYTKTKGINLKCILCKDYQNVIEKS